MLIVTGIIKIESVEELERVKNALVKRAVKSRGDEGCIAYTFSANLEDPTEIMLTEKWENEELLNAHLQIPDEEFNSLIGTAKIERVLVVSNEVITEKELLNR